MPLLPLLNTPRTLSPSLQLMCSSCLSHLSGCPGLAVLPQYYVLSIMLTTFPSMRNTTLNAVLKVWSRKCQAEGNNHFPHPAGYVVNTAQGTVNCLCCKSMLLPPVQVDVDGGSLGLFQHS